MAAYLARAENVFVVVAPWPVTLIETRTSLPLAVAGSCIVQTATPLRRRPVARRGVVPARTVQATVAVARAAPLSTRVTRVPTANALPATGLAGTAVGVAARSVTGAYSYALFPSGAVSSAMTFPFASSWKESAQYVNLETPPRSALPTLNVATPFAYLPFADAAAAAMNLL